jgi:2-haloacid dehalogenase
MTEAVYFDLFGTLLELDGLGAACEQALPDRGAQLAATWRARQLEISWLRTAMRAFVDFDQVTGDALDAAVDELGLRRPLEGRKRLSRAFAELDLAPGAHDAVRELRADGVRTGVLTNAASGTLRTVLERTRLDAILDDALSVDAVAAFKPDPSVYRMATDASGLPAHRIEFVTANGWDAAGAGAFGLRVVWLRADPRARIPRVGAPVPRIATWRTLAEMLRS